MFCCTTNISNKKGKEWIGGTNSSNAMQHCIAGVLERPFGVDDIISTQNMECMTSWIIEFPPTYLLNYYQAERSCQSIPVTTFYYTKQTHTQPILSTVFDLICTLFLGFVCSFLLHKAQHNSPFKIFALSVTYIYIDLKC